MVRFQEVNKSLGDFQLCDISFELPEGYIMGMIGENGAGKTSLLNMILGLYEPDSGELGLFGKHYASDSQASEIKNKLGYVLTDEDLFLGSVSLRENAVLYGRYYENYDEQCMADYCHAFDLDTRKKWREISKGEKLKFQFAFALAHRPRLLVLDEPVANFDPEFREQFFHEITQFVSDGLHSVILATHQTKDLDRIADYVTFVHEGRVVFSADKESLTERFRLVQGEDYKINLLKPERVVYKEKGAYVTSALVVHRRIDTYDRALTVCVPAIEDIMYYMLKGGKQGIGKVRV